LNFAELLDFEFARLHALGHALLVQLFVHFHDRVLELLDNEPVLELLHRLRLLRRLLLLAKPLFALLIAIHVCGAGVPPLGLCANPKQLLNPRPHGRAAVLERSVHIASRQRVLLLLSPSLWELIAARWHLVY
jgi:hypothetical protein